MKILLILLGVAGLIWAVYALIPTVYYKWIYPRRYKVEKKLRLTFDDGPDEIYTEQLLRLLRLHRIKATFFVVAEKAEKYPEIIEQIVSEGHEIGLHCNSHHKALFQTPAQIERDIAQGLETLSTLGVTPKYYRPPHGYVNLPMLQQIKKHNLSLLLWNVLPRDWMGKSSDEIFWAMLRDGSEGGIICLHDSGVGTGGEIHAPKEMIQSLKKFIPFMEMNGYYFGEG